MNKLQKAFGIGSLVFALAGCSEQPGEQPSELAYEYHHSNPVVEEKPAIEKNIGETVTLEGRILDTQLGTLVYNYRLRDSAPYRFLYVRVESGDGRRHTLIYPTNNKPIWKEDAVIKYRVLNSFLDAEMFIHNFIYRSGNVSGENIFIEAEGIITADGIHYKDFGQETKK